MNVVTPGGALLGGTIDAKPFRPVPFPSPSPFALPLPFFLRWLPLTTHAPSPFNAFSFSLASSAFFFSSSSRSFRIFSSAARRLASALACLSARRVRDPSRAARLVGSVSVSALARISSWASAMRQS